MGLHGPGEARAADADIGPADLMLEWAEQLRLVEHLDPSYKS